jgi:beta-glucosidase
MSDMGLKAYRFSVSWSRIFPEGTGPLNESGADFYDRLVDALLAKGIEPWLTLFHWDYPLALYRRGGWMNPRSPEWFADYAEAMAKRLGDRVEHWMTLNEPPVFIGMGHRTGEHAPGLKLPDPDLVGICHNVLKAHGLAVQRLREYCSKPPKLGLAPNPPVVGVDPAFEEDAEVVEAARRGTVLQEKPESYIYHMPLWMDTAALGRYPEPFVETFGQHLPAQWEKDLSETIHQPLDFCGCNFYSNWQLQTRDAEGRLVRRTNEQLGEGFPRTHFQWPVTPSVLYWGPRFFYERYQLPIVVTENGLSSHDWVDLDGVVKDYARIDFLRRYLREYRRAAAEGIPLLGYFQWSLLDNFEWAEGYRHRFGLIHVDYQTLKRTPKESARWYAEVIATNGAHL